MKFKFLMDNTDFGDIEIERIQFDCDKIQDGDVFVALKGSSFDGHDFVQKASERGAKIAVVERKVDSKIRQIVVKKF